MIDDMTTAERAAAATSADSEWSSRQASDDSAFLTGPVLRAVLPVLFGLLAVLVAMLTLAALDIAITTTSTVVAVGSLALLTLAAAVLVRRRRGVRSARLSADLFRGSAAWRRIGGALVTVVVLVGAVTVAQSLQPSRSEQFVSLEVSNPALYADGSVIVPSSGGVDVGWALRGYDVALDADPAVTVAVDGSTPADLQLAPAVDPADDGTGFTSAHAGRVSFTAPALPGRYQIVITVVDPADPAEGQELVLSMEVTA